MINSNLKPALKVFFRRTALAASVLAAVSLMTARAEIMVVEARGKDAATCEVNARLNATRTLMNNMTTRDFVTSKSAEIRKIIIARPQDFTTSYRLLEEDKSGSSIAVKAEVNVDTAKLEQTLKSLGAVITKSGELLKRELRTSERKALLEFFGEETGTGITSAVITGKDNAAPVSESLLPGFEIGGGPADDVLSPGEEFLISLRRPEFAKLSRRVKVVMTGAGVPADAASSEKEMINNDVLRSSEKTDFLPLQAPERPGTYEIRVFNDADDDQSLLGRYGFRVAGEEAVSFVIPRDVFAPKEEFFIEVLGLDENPGDGWLVVARDDGNTPRKDVQALKSTKNITEIRGPEFGFSMTAPEEEGDYALLFYRGCRFCKSYWRTDRNSPAVSMLKFRVRKPRGTPPAESALIIPSEIYAGDRVNFIFNPTPEWEGKSASLRVTRKGTDRPVIDTWYNCNPGKYYDRFGPVYEAGEYTAVITMKGGDNPPEVSRDFIVRESLYDVPGAVLNAPYDEIEPDSSFTLTGTNRIGVRDSSFVALLPKNASGNAKEISEKYRDDCYHVGHNVKFSVNMGTYEMAPGSYEIRLYSSNEEDGALLAKQDIRIMSEKEIEAAGKKLLKELESPPPGSAKAPTEEESLKKLSRKIDRDFYVPALHSDPAPESVSSRSEIPFRFGGAPAREDISDPEELYALRYTVIDYGREQRGCAVPDIAERSSPDSDLENFYRMLGQDPDEHAAGSGYGQDYSLYFPEPDAAGIPVAGYPGYRFSKARVDIRECKDELREVINEKTRLDITLGRDGNFDAAIMDFGTAILQNYQFATDIGKIRDAIVFSQEMYGHGVAALDGLSEKDMTKLGSNALAMILKGALKACDGSECISKMITKNKKTLESRLLTMSDEEYKRVYGSLKDACDPKHVAFLENLDSARKMIFMPDKEYRKLYEQLSNNSGMAKNYLKMVAEQRDRVARGEFIRSAAEKGAGTIDQLSALAAEGAVDGTVSGNTAMNAAIAILSLDPNIAIGIASVKFAYESALASRDFVRDVSVIRVYSAWKNFGDNEKEAFGGSWKEDPGHSARALKQAKETMCKTMGNELTRKALASGNRTVANAYVSFLKKGGDPEGHDSIKLNPSDISDAEAWDFLRLQFEQWENIEKKNSDFKDDLRRWADDFMNLNTEEYPNCDRDFRSWYNGQLYEQNRKKGAGTRLHEGLTGMFSFLWENDCDAEIEAFKAYIDNRKRIENELVEWGEGSYKNRCSSKTMKKKSQDMLCLYMDGSFGPSRYKEEVAYMGCECGWDNFDESGHLHANLREAKRMREKEIMLIAKTLGNNDLVHCLCGGSSGRAASGASIQVGIYYHPKTGKKSDCGGSGACLASGFGCWHYPMPTHGKALMECGYYKALDNYRVRQAVDRNSNRKGRTCLQGL